MKKLIALCVLFLAASQLKAQGLVVTFANSIENNTSVTATNPSAEATLQVVTLQQGSLNGVGSTVKVTGSGSWTTASAQTPTLTIKAKLSTLAACTGGTTLTLVSSVSGATTASLTNVPFTYDYTFSTISTGGSGTLNADGGFSSGLSSVTAAASTYLGQVTSASSGIDLTAQLFICVSATFSSSNASNNVIGRRLTVTPLNFAF